MTKKLVDLAWQDEYVREFSRVNGPSRVMVFGLVEPGGMYTVTLTDAAGDNPYRTRLRRGQCVANTEELKRRPACVATTFSLRI